MFRSLSYCIFSSIILFILAPSTVYGDYCYGSDITCWSSLHYVSWCCNSDQTCGTSYNDCDSTSSLTSPTIAIIAVVSVLLFVMLLSCCIYSRQRQQRLRAAYANSNNRVITNPYQQQSVRHPIRVVHVRPVYNVGAAPPSQPYPSMYEAPPPSYEVATTNVPSVHQSSTVPPESN